MKVILIKDCKDGKANTIIDVAPGYGTNYLIKNGFGLPYNEKTKAILNKKLSELESEEQAKRLEATKLKYELENLVLEFQLKETNNLIHHSISNKKIEKAILDKGFKLPKHSLVENEHIASFGTTVVKAKIYKDIIANLQVKITKE
ncbi:50S ribosomal protein L9 [Mycoplasma iguanae]|uniref:Large ribosomal subunit protein bL9 n=1 Tax=Mycoplasma iguanae TaxID=292461 RepID=A0ABY5R8D4_9MOLU|nr:50S ribosomal protein L9 [Mycoplasma iguanae]UVD81754.1 50S ribosomal protein L9 [Mycoplasma iguanae]